MPCRLCSVSKSLGWVQFCFVTLNQRSNELIISFLSLHQSLIQERQQKEDDRKIMQEMEGAEEFLNGADEEECEDENGETKPTAKKAKMVANSSNCMDVGDSSDSETEGEDDDEPTAEDKRFIADDSDDMDEEVDYDAAPAQVADCIHKPVTVKATMSLDGSDEDVAVDWKSDAALAAEQNEVEDEENAVESEGTQVSGEEDEVMTEGEERVLATLSPICDELVVPADDASVLSKKTRPRKPINMDSTSNDKENVTHASTPKSQWRCLTCTLFNKKSSRKCSVCASARPR
jgi:hypothetical protein